MRMMIYDDLHIYVLYYIYDMIYIYIYDIYIICS